MYIEESKNERVMKKRKASFEKNVGEGLGDLK